MIRKPTSLVLGGLLLLGLALSAGADEAVQNKEMDQFFKGKAKVYARDWPGVRSEMEAYVKDYPDGKMRDEAFYWLAGSLDRLARDAKDVFSAIDLKRKAFVFLDRLIKEFPGSLWRDDAKELQVTIAGGLAFLGAEDQRKFLEDAVRSNSQNGIEVKKAALNSIIALNIGTVVPVMRNFLKTESDAGLRKYAVLLLSRKHSRETMSILEDAARNDRDAEVRKEAGLRLEKIRISQIPVQVKYYCFEVTVTDTSEYAKVPEGKVVPFTVPHGRAGSQSKAKKAIDRFFDGHVDFSGSVAGGSSSAQEQLGPLSRTAHRIAGFYIELEPASITKTPHNVSGRVRFGDTNAPFSVDGENDLILAARRGQQQAVIYLEMAPKDVAEETEERESTGSKPLSPDREPSLRNAYHTMGMVIYSDRDYLETRDLKSSKLFDYGPAKAEIPGLGGTWTLTGQLLLLNKERVLVGRMAKLIRPDGTTAASGEEIRVPVGNPENFKTGGGIDAKPVPAPPSAAGVETTYRLDNGGWIRASRPTSGDRDTAGGLVDFGTAQASLPGPRGNWTLTGYILLLKSSQEIMASKAVLTNPEGKIAAQGTLLFVPLKNPDRFRLAVERSN